MIYIQRKYTHLQFPPDIEEEDDQVEVQNDEVEDTTHTEPSVVIEISADNTRANRISERATVRSWEENISEDFTSNYDFVDSLDLDSDHSIFPPIIYVRRFLDDDLLDLIVEMSNLYSVQKDPSKPLSTNKKEIEQWIGLCYFFSLIKISNTRLYWSTDLIGLRDITAEVMSRDRWYELKSKFHLVDNSTLEVGDKFAKVRPMITHLQSKFRQIPMVQNICIDEQIVPFKGKSCLKQYIPSKPHKWGYKIFVLADDQGITYDFMPYGGKIDPVQVPGVPDLKASSNVVLHLTQHVSPNRNHLLFFDNWFTSLPLMQYLAELKIYCCGTVRHNRIPGIKFSKTQEKELMKKGRGSYEERRLVSENCDLTYIRWYDNKTVHLLSSFAKANPIHQVDRYDQKTKRVISVNCPDIVRVYNKSMGGVDKADFLISLYRTSIKSKKYYMRLIYHMLDMVMVNSWLLYKRDVSLLKLPRKDTLGLGEFKLKAAFTLMKEGKTMKRGRPSGDVLPTKKKKKKCTFRSCRPEDPVRLDKVGHFPMVDKDRRICRMEGCDGRTNVTCIKCKVHLCFNRANNHFYDYHN